jgi:hypothetical protein
MEGTISIPDFMAHLRSEGLVIVSAAELEASRLLAERESQRKLMRKKAIAFAEVIKAGFIPGITTNQGLVHWVNSGRINLGEAYKETNGRWMLMTSALRRLGYAE